MYLIFQIHCFQLQSDLIASESYIRMDTSIRDEDLNHGTFFNKIFVTRSPFDAITLIMIKDS